MTLETVSRWSTPCSFRADPARRVQARIDNLTLAAQFDISRSVEKTLQILAGLASDPEGVLVPSKEFGWRFVNRRSLFAARRGLSRRRARRLRGGK